MSSYQSQMDAVLDDLTYLFHEHRATRNTITGTMPLINAIPDMPYVNWERLCDRVHECLAGIHSEWNKWSINIESANGCGGDLYFVLRHEDECLVQLQNHVVEWYTDAGLLDIVRGFEMNYVKELVQRTHDVFHGIQSTPIYPMFYDFYLSKYVLMGMCTQLYGVEKIHFKRINYPRLWRHHAVYYDSLSN